MFKINLQLFAEEVEGEEQPPAEKTYTQSDIDALTAKIDALTADMKRKALQAAGLSGADVDHALEYVTGTSAEEIAESIASLGEQLPVLARVAAISKPQGIDPNPGNPRRPEPKAPDLHKVGQDLYQSLKSRGRLRGKL